MITKGFVTIATGDLKYYKMARNLLLSYRYTTDDPLPFCIISDRENEYTKMFDKTIIIDNPTNSYLDKLKMLSSAPFDENIFLDADSLVFNDINILFNYMPSKGVSCPGKVLDITSNSGWFTLDGIGEYKNQVDFIPSMHSGITFFRNDDTTQKIYQRCLEIKDNYQKYSFAYFKEPADEPILALAMALEKVPPIELPSDFKCFIFLNYKNVSANMKNNKLKQKGEKSGNYLLWHLGNKGTTMMKYKCAVDVINNNYSFLRVIFYWIHDAFYGFIQTTKTIIKKCFKIKSKKKVFQYIRKAVRK